MIMKTKFTSWALAMLLSLVSANPLFPQQFSPDLRGLTLRRTPVHISVLPGRPGIGQMLPEPGYTDSGYHADTIFRYSIYSGNTRTANTYDDNGMLVSTLEQMWVISQWTNSKQTTGTYDQDGNLLTETSRKWVNNEWVNDRLLTYTYDGSGKRLTAVGQQWDGTVWTNSEQSEFTWDAGGHLLTELYQQWDGFDWMNSSNTIYTYDGNGNCLTSLGQMWDGMAWMDDGLETFTWDLSNNMLSDMFQFWDGTAWGNIWMGIYTYDGDGNRITTLEQMWDGMVWLDNYADTMTYEAGNYIAYINYYSWDGVTWDPYSRGDFTYDATGNYTSKTWQVWNMGGWENNLKVDYENQEGLIKADAFSWTGTTWTPGDSYFSVVYNDSGEKYMFYPGGEAAVEVLVYFSAIISDIDPVAGKQPGLFTVYPNPASDFIFITPAEPGVTIGSIHLLDLSGKELPVTFSSERADLVSLKRGLYMLKVTTSDGQTATKKVIKQ